MSYDYDKLYGETAQALGAPTQAFVDFFQERQADGLRVLDVGCGQGRDALFIARMGHRVVGIDLSSNGIRDMIAVAQGESLDIEGVVADLTTYVPSGMYDAVLIDRTLHMLPEKARLDALSRLIATVSEGGWVLIADERANMQGFKAVFSASDANWRTVRDTGDTLFLQRA